MPGKMLFSSVDRWERSIELLTEGWRTRGELARILGLSPRQASRIIKHIQEIGFVTERSDLGAWHISE
jgi:DNA-binding IclR family transcriptional regulator